MKELDIKLEKIIKEETEEIKTKAIQITREVASETVEELKKISPKKSGIYASGWTFEKTETGARIYNEERGPLTHLLEFGHQIIKKGKSVGRAKKYPHIKPAEKKAVKKILERFAND